MKVIIGGCGRVGSMLALRFEAEGHDVAVIDRDPAALLSLSRQLKGRTIRGLVFDRDALDQAGITECDAFVAVTSGDNSNVVAATIAKNIFHIPHVLARIYDPRRAEIYHRLGIPTVSSVTWAANEIFSLLMHPDLTRDATLGNGEVSLVRVEIDPDRAGGSIGSLQLDGDIRPVAVIRDGHAFLPSADEVIATGDIIEFAVATDALGQLQSLIRQ